MSTEGSDKKSISVGPWGGHNGLIWDDRVHSTVKQLVIAHGAAIDSIQIEYDERGSSVWSDKHGRNGGWKTDKVKLASPEEFLTSIEGYYGKKSEWGPITVRSLTFKSNKRTYGPFGVEQGTYFSLQETASNIKIVGFHGMSGWYLDSIGAYVKPIDQNEQKQHAKTLLRTPFNYPTIGTDQNLAGYSLIQNCNVLFAMTPKDDSTAKPAAVPVPVPKMLSGQFSDSEISDVGTKHELTTNVEKFPSKVEGVVAYGPFGGTGGAAFDDGIYSGIRQIKLSRNIGVVYIKVQYDRNGEAVWEGRHGGTGGFKSDKIVFDYPNEILTHITGTFAPTMVMGTSVIKSLTFHTTKKQHGPYGEEQGACFTTKLKEGKIVGIHGRSGLFLDALGVHAIEGKVHIVETKTPTLTNTPNIPYGHTDHKNKTPTVTNTPNTFTAMIPKEHAGAITEIDNPHWTNKLLMTNGGKVEEVAYGVIKEPAPCGPGPWGGDVGRAWDDGVFSGISQIHLTREAEGICSVQIEYDRNGQFIWSAKHGGNGGTSPHRIKLEYPHEVITCISGYYGCISKDQGQGPKIIKSLTFFTSRGKYGPFGEQVGTFFTSTATEGKLVGFHGRSSLYLDAIGVHMQHWLGSDQKTSHKPSLFKKY
ncbi:jacalin-related lectin 3-like [Malus domestica]|uniref:jacalin-related lectin 3-like n=1 Tax=Malus domestica TaxID=3750 RepID=UPI003976F2A3